MTSLPKIATLVRLGHIANELAMRHITGITLLKSLFSYEIMKCIHLYHYHVHEPCKNIS